MDRPRFSALFIFFVLGAIVLTSCSRMEAKMSNNPAPFNDGGCCTYISYDGNAEIVRVTQSQASLAQAKVLGGPGYEGYEVWFRFVPRPDAPKDRIKAHTSREHLFTLQNSWYVGPRYLETYDIKAGRKYPCVLMILEKGTCTPVVFDFIEFDRTDYFESGS